MRSETMCECLVHVSVNQVLLKSLLFGDGLYYLIELFQLFRGVIKPNKRAYFDVIGPLLAENSPLTNSTFNQLFLENIKGPYFVFSCGLE